MKKVQSKDIGENRVEVGIKDAVFATHRVASKLLYCKRTDKNELAFDPDTVISNCRGSADLMLGYLVHNGPEFYSSLEELDEFMGIAARIDTFQAAARLRNEYDESAHIGARISNAVLGRAVANTNMHPSSRKSQFRPIVKSSGVLSLRMASSNRRRLHFITSSHDTLRSSFSSTTTEVMPHEARIARRSFPMAHVQPSPYMLALQAVSSYSGANEDATLERTGNMWEAVTAKMDKM